MYRYFIVDIRNNRNIYVNPLPIDPLPCMTIYFVTDYEEPFSINIGGSNAGGRIFIDDNSKYGFILALEENSLWAEFEILYGMISTYIYRQHRREFSSIDDAVDFVHDVCSDKELTDLMIREVTSYIRGISNRNLDSLLKNIFLPMIKRWEEEGKPVF